MPRKKSNSRVLRQLAEEYLQQMPDPVEWPANEREDFLTSLIRQWITYDGNATFLFGDEQIYLSLARTPLGRLCIREEPVVQGWSQQLQEDWKINPEDLSDIMAQLSLGQSAEVTNSEGVALRLWVNPKERSRGIEELDPQPPPPGWKRDYRKIAADVLKEQFGASLEATEMEAIVCSVAKQWQQFEGHACLFLDGNQQLSLVLTERDNGNCNVAGRWIPVGLESLLFSLGFSPEVVPEVIASINLGLKIEFRDRKGVPSALWHDPKDRRITVRPLVAAPPPPQSSAPPSFCPKCGAVLNLWDKTEQRQTCPLCGHTVSRC